MGLAAAVGEPGAERLAGEVAREVARARRPSGLLACAFRMRSSSFASARRFWICSESTRARPSAPPNSRKKLKRGLWYLRERGERAREGARARARG